jgi:hypothetical protein
MHAPAVWPARLLAHELRRKASRRSSGGAPLEVFLTAAIPLRSNDREIDAIVAFLRTLTDAAYRQ